MGHLLPSLVSLMLAFANDVPVPWGGFRGPNGSGVSISGTLPPSLDLQESLAWKIAIDPGYSSPVLTEDCVFLTTHEGKKLFTVCFDRASGDVLWEVEAPQENDDPYPGPNSPVSPTPATDGDFVFVLFPCFGLVAYDLEGEEIWRHPLGPFNVPHVMASSPVVAGKALVLLCDQDTLSFLLALDKETGKQLWKVERPGVTHGYSTPIVVQPEEGPVEVIVVGSYQVCAYALESGEKLWWVDGMAWQSNTVPVVAKGMLLVHSSVPPLTEFGGPQMTDTWEEALAARDTDQDGKISKAEWSLPAMQLLWFLYDLDNDDLLAEDEWHQAEARGRAEGGLFAIRLGGRGNVTESHMVWSTTERRGMAGYASPIVYGDVLYMLKDGGILTAFDIADGHVLKQGRIGRPDAYYASPVAVDGKLIAASQKGQLVIVQAGAEWESRSSHDLKEEIWATPAIADGQLIVRTQQSLYCFRGAAEE
ncbi:MAG: PQQ-binding-like beta-propeller repeat protein [Planctomycetota bacterium]